MATASEDSYETVLKSRYCRRSPLLEILSETHKTLTWRQMWIWLAEAEKELGLKEVTEEAIMEMKKMKAEIDWPTIRDEERRLKHDVMAHNHAFGKLCPKAKGIIHLGATSCFVQDNSDLIIQREAIDVIVKRLAMCLKRLGEFAQRTVDVVTVGRTHYQAASLVTYGKRAVLWCADLVTVLKDLERFRAAICFRGAKGATGTQDSFLTLFEGDESQVEALDDLVTKKAGFVNRFKITGQTYSRMQDCKLVYLLAQIGIALKKICADIRILQGYGEIMEPFESEQIGSSAMPYKRNPMKSERVCSIARRLINAPQELFNTAGDQGLERTLDDSAIRRITISDAFLSAEAILITFQNIAEGLTVQTRNVERIVATEMPFLCLEKAMMYLCAEGVDRQAAHHKIRELALAAKEEQQHKVVKVEAVLADSFFDKVRDRVLSMAYEPISFTGRCQSQTMDFLKVDLYPTIEKYISETKMDETVTLDV